MKGHFRLYSLICLMVILWSGNFVIAKIALREFPPLLLSGLRVALAGCFMLPIYVSRRMRPEDTGGWSWSDVPILIYLGMFGVAVNQLFFVLGLSRTSVAHSAIMISLTPIFVLLIAAALNQEQITPRKALGMLIACGGVAILQAVPQPGRGPGSAPSALGDSFIFLAALTFSLFTVIGKRVASRLSATTVNTFAYVGGALALSPITILQAKGFSFARVSPAAWSSLIYMALFPSVICYLIYFYALTRITASRLSAFTYLQPLLATLMAVAALGERVSAPLVAGGTVIFAGVYLTERG